MRYDLMPVRGLEEVTKVLNNKLEKHDINDWRAGIPWSDILSNLEKHLLAVEKGEDYDESGLLNIAHVAEEALILCEYYKTYPQGDDRIIGVDASKKSVVALDLDDTVFDFAGAYKERFGTNVSDYWECDYEMMKNLEILKNDKDFWVNLPVKNRPTFEVDYYVTARDIPVEWTEEAIAKNNLPKAKVYTLPWNVSKIEKLKELKVTIFIDDKYQTYKECEANGIFCFLMDSHANQYYNVGHRRIKDLNLSNIK